MPSRERVLSTTLVVLDGCSRRLSQHVSRHMRSPSFVPAIAPAGPGHQHGPCGCCGRLCAAAVATGRRQQRAGRKSKRAESRSECIYDLDLDHLDTARQLDKDYGSEVRKPRLRCTRIRLRRAQRSISRDSATPRTCRSPQEALLRRQRLGPAFEAPRRRNATDRHGKASELLSAVQLRVRRAPLLP